MRAARAFLAALALAGCHPRPTIDDNPPRPPGPPPQPPGKPVPELKDPREVHLGSLTQLTFGGENAEAYWSWGGDQLIFQTTRDGNACDRIMRMPATGGDVQLVSTGEGRTTCSYFFPGDQEVLYASTHEVSPDCPPPPDRSKGYVWALYDYDIYKARADGSNLTKLFGAPGKYDAEATICARDGSVIFTSDKDGDLDLYRMNADGSNVTRITDTPGYDGGAFFSSDCSKIVWRASHPTGSELVDYRELLARHLVRPTSLEIWTADADGSNPRQLTYLGAASFAPFFRANAKRVLFSSNYGDPQGREFDIWAIDTDGTNLERITYTAGFDGFPMFSPDGEKLAFSSNRGSPPPDPVTHNSSTNVFVADWLPRPNGQMTPLPADDVRRIVDYLASDELEGRGVGTRGLELAQTFVENELKQAGAAGAMAGGSFRQPFQVNVQTLIGPGTRLAIDGAPVTIDEARPIVYSGSGKAKGDVVAAGYGIVDAAHGLDDYKGKAVKGKVVVVKRFAPDDPKLDAETRDRLGDFNFKASVARAHGAKALIIVDVPAAGTAESALPGRAVPPPGATIGPAAPAPAPTPPSGEPGPSLLGPPPPPPPPTAAPPALQVWDLGLREGADAGLPVVVVTRARGEALFTGKHTVDLAVELLPVKADTANLVGIIKAGAAKAGPEPIVVGAHLDHLGMGGPGTGSLEPTMGIHNGADDNASGVAALIEVAKQLTANRAKLTRDVYLVAFSGEEMGVLGSKYFVAHTPYTGVARAMLNMDMVGRLRGAELAVLGSDSAPEWKALVDPICTAAQLHCTESGSGYGPSDHMSFYIAGSPVLHFFTGPHADYHKMSDDAPLINAGGLAQVSKVVADVALAAAAAPALTYKKESAPSGGGDSRIAGASLGTIPEYADDGKIPGLLLSAVVGGGPADKAGLKRGDRIIKIGKDDVRNVQDLMLILEQAKPGTEVDIVFLRDGKQQTVKATFGAPRARH
ncbi:MAG TPA: M20/M25/M40 family metallo-hydrolase [Kofleriaceae bacterium]|nr:M20/M25/M40 family metallo-hydrolase [Kofleriaceae bacterium]